jgi:hypothetical protein
MGHPAGAKARFPFCVLYAALKRRSSTVMDAAIEGFKSKSKAMFKSQRQCFKVKSKVPTLAANNAAGMGRPVL